MPAGSVAGEIGAVTADSTHQDPAPDGPGFAPSRSSALIHGIKLVSAGIVGLAALLGAIAVIIDVLDKDPKPVVAAKFAPLEVSPTTLAEFQATQKFTTAEQPQVRLHLAAATSAQQTPGQDGNSTPGQDGDGDTTNAEEQQACPSPQQVEAGVAVPEGCPSGGQPCPTAKDVAELRVEVPDGCPDPGLNCPTASEIAENAAVPPGCPVEGLPGDSDPANEQQTTEGLDRQYEMGRGCSGDPTGSRCALTAVTQSAGGQNASRAQRILRVREILAGTRTRLLPRGKREPMGIMVSLDVTVTGMSGERLKVYWSMLSAKTSRALGQSWLRNTRAATLHPRADTDQLQKDLWLPLPGEPGRYRARVTLVDEAGRHFPKRSGVFH